MCSLIITQPSGTSGNIMVQLNVGTLMELLISQQFEGRSSYHLL
jgi:hypothetical protein